MCQPFGALSLLNYNPDININKVKTIKYCDSCRGKAGEETIMKLILSLIFCISRVRTQSDYYSGNQEGVFLLHFIALYISIIRHNVDAINYKYKF